MYRFTYECGMDISPFGSIDKVVYSNNEFGFGCAQCHTKIDTSLASYKSSSGDAACECERLSSRTSALHRSLQLI